MIWQILLMSHTKGSHQDSHEIAVLATYHLKQRFSTQTTPRPVFYHDPQFVGSRRKIVPFPTTFNQILLLLTKKPLKCVFSKTTYWIDLNKNLVKFVTIWALKRSIILILKNFPRPVQNLPRPVCGSRPVGWETLIYII